MSNQEYLQIKNPSEFFRNKTKIIDYFKNESMFKYCETVSSGTTTPLDPEKFHGWFMVITVFSFYSNDFLKIHISPKEISVTNTETRETHKTTFGAEINPPLSRVLLWLETLLEVHIYAKTFKGSLEAVKNTAGVSNGI